MIYAWRWGKWAIELGSHNGLMFGFTLADKTQRMNGVMLGPLVLVWYPPEKPAP